jgi:ornithine cyclodeaminase/alanine dehydrogenase-like protein (mu-crystallin family)
MIGAGFQAPFQLRAAAEQRPFAKVLAFNPHPEMLPRLAEASAEIGLPFEAVPLSVSAPRPMSSSPSRRASRRS